MKFSIVTATKNNESTIIKTLESINLQKFNDFELIVVDANSNDKTIEIVKKFQFPKLTVLKQEGLGVYKAFNQGIKKSIGEIIIILNADDFFKDKDSLSKINQIFSEDPSLELIISNVKIIGKTNNVIRNYSTKKFHPFMFYFGHMPPHPGSFIKKKVYDKYGLYSEKFDNAGDFEYLLRVILRNKIKFQKINEYFVLMTYGGQSNRNLKSFIKNTFEIKKALKLNRLFSSYILIMFRFLIKIFQFYVK